MGGGGEIGLRGSQWEVKMRREDWEGVEMGDESESEEEG